MKYGSDSRDGDVFSSMEGNSNGYAAPGNLAECVEKFEGLETLLMCCESTYNPRIQKEMVAIKKKIHTLEYEVFWARASRFFVSTPQGPKSVIKAHKIKFGCICSKCNWLQNIGPHTGIRRALNEARLRKCTWKPYFEERVKHHGFTFGRGRDDERYDDISDDISNVIPRTGVKIILDTLVVEDFCSGEQEDWEGACFGNGFSNITNEKALMFFRLLEDLGCTPYHPLLNLSEKDRNYVLTSPLCPRESVNIDTNPVPVENVSVACQPFFAFRMQELKAKADNLESILFWAEIEPCFYCPLAEDCMLGENSVVGLHRRVFVGCPCFRCIYYHTENIEDFEAQYEREKITRDPVCIWRKEIERVATENALTFAASHNWEENVFEYSVGYIKITMDLTVDAHLCSGADGTWEAFTGFGKRMMTDVAKREGCIRFMNTLMDQIKKIRGN